MWAGQQPVQAIPPSGEQAAGLTGYDLARASETVAHHGRAELFLPWGQGGMPVGWYGRDGSQAAPRSAKASSSSATASQVDGLTAALYLARAPWRAPVIVPVPADGAVQLPPGVRNSGPLRVLLRVEDPWVVTDWPGGLAVGSYACDAPGMPVGADPEEQALCRFLAGEGDLPASPAAVGPSLAAHPSRWRPDQRGAPADLRERCSAKLAAQPGPALAALLDAGLDSAACVAALIATGLADGPAGDRG